MTTAQEIVDDSAALILVDEANTSLEANESAIMTRFLNDFLAELHSSGVDIGYRPVSNPSDVVTIPTGARQAIKYGLAFRTNAVFGLPLPQEVALLAPALERSLKSSYMRLPKVRPPRTLPQGTGNHYNVYDLNTFYAISQPDAQLRLELSTTVSIATINTPVVVTGPWTVDRDVNITTLGQGDMQYILQEPYLARLTADLTLSSTNGDRYTFYFTRNGATVAQSAYEVTANRVQDINFQWTDTIYRDDTIRLVVENNTGTNDLTITHGHFLLD